MDSDTNFNQKYARNIIGAYIEVHKFPQPFSSSWTSVKTYEQRNELRWKTRIS